MSKFIFALLLLVSTSVFAETYAGVDHATSNSPRNKGHLTADRQPGATYREDDSQTSLVFYTGHTFKNNFFIELQAGSLGHQYAMSADYRGCHGCLMESDVQSEYIGVITGKKFNLTDKLSLSMAAGLAHVQARNYERGYTDMTNFNNEVYVDSPHVPTWAEHRNDTDEIATYWQTHISYSFGAYTFRVAYREFKNIINSQWTKSTNVYIVSTGLQYNF